MKKIVFALFALLSLNIIAHAQKNSIFVYGNLGANSVTSNDTAGNSYSISGINVRPGIGYQFSDKLTAGIEFSVFYAYQKNTYSSISESFSKKSYGITPGVFLRYSQPIGGRFFIYAHFNADYASSRFSKIISGYNGDTYSFTTSITPGLGFNIKNGYAVIISFGSLTYSYSNNGYSGTGSVLNLNIGNSATIGFTKNFISHRTRSKAETKVN